MRERIPGNQHEGHLALEAQPDKMEIRHRLHIDDHRLDKVKEVGPA